MKMQPLIYRHETFLLRFALFSGGLLLAGNADRPYVSFGLVLLVCWTMTRFFDDRPFYTLGMTIRGSTLWLFLGGVFLSSVASVGASIGYYAVQGWVLSWPYLEPFSSWNQLAVKALLPAIVVAVYEEVAFRGYLLQLILKHWGALAGLVGSSILFGLWHIWQQDLLGLLSLTLHGIVLGLTYLKTRSLWLPIGFHFGWNFLAHYSSEWGYLQVDPSPFLWPWFQDIARALSPYLIDNYMNILAAIVLILFIAILPLKPHPRDKEITENYIKPGP